MRSKEPGVPALVVALVVVQTAMLIALFMRMNDLDGEVTRGQVTGPETAYIEQTQATQPGPVAVPGYTDDDQLRQIIREELALALEELAGYRNNRPEGATVAEAAPVINDVDPAEYERRRMHVEEQLNYYTGVGQISDVQMQRLQADIARLDPASRRAMLMELTRAMNSGRLEGRL